MLPLGVFRKEQLSPANLEGGFLRRRQFIALDLYDCLDDLSQGERDKIQERMLGRFPTHNGTFKYTHARRFDDFDGVALRTIDAEFRASRAICVHDIGVSDGRTSCDLYGHLSTRYGDRLRFVASDYAPYLFVLKRKNSARRVIIDEQDNILQIVTPPFVFNIARPDSLKFYSLNHVVRCLANFTQFYTRALLKDYKTGRREIERTKLELLCRECRDCIAGGTNFSFERYDVLSGPRGRFDVIRVMNLLNYCYFPEIKLKLAVHNIRQSLAEGGLLITGSNVEQGSVVNGGIYRKTGERMERLAASGKGSQVDALVLNAIAASPQEIGMAAS